MMLHTCNNTRPDIIGLTELEKEAEGEMELDIEFQKCVDEDKAISKLEDCSDQEFPSLKIGTSPDLFGIQKFEGKL